MQRLIETRHHQGPNRQRARVRERSLENPVIHARRATTALLPRRHREGARHIGHRLREDRAARQATDRRHRAARRHVARAVRRAALTEAAAALRAAQVHPDRDPADRAHAAVAVAVVVVVPPALAVDDKWLWI